jgi:hypothetical protein
MWKHSFLPEIHRKPSLTSPLTLPGSIIYTVNQQSSYSIIHCHDRKRQKLELTDSFHVSISFSIKSRHYFSLQHIQSAALFTRQCYQIEKNHDEVFSNDLIADHWSCVTGAIFAATSFLEATINEVFADTVDHPDGELASYLDVATKQLMADMWKRDIPRTAHYQIIEKFQIALTLARKPLLDLSRSPFQDVQTLIMIRNDLIHFEPVWTSIEVEKVHKRILSLQQEKKFALNPLTSSGNPFYPDKCLGHGCAKWAVSNSIQFVEDFFSRMSIPVFFDHIRSRLNTEP